MLFKNSNFSHVDRVEPCGPVLPEAVPPIVRVHPEVVERTAEDLERQPVQVKGVPVSSLWGIMELCSSELSYTFVGLSYTQRSKFCRSFNDEKTKIANSFI